LRFHEGAIGYIDVEEYFVRLLQNPFGDFKAQRMRAQQTVICLSAMNRGDSSGHLDALMPKDNGQGLILVCHRRASKAL